MAATKRSKSADHAWKSNLVMGEDIDDPRWTVEENGDDASFKFAGKVYAQMRLAGETLEIDFKKPKDESDLKTVEKHYTRLEKPAGWLRIRTPARRDPRPMLEAKFGMLFGTIQRELGLAADEGKFKSISAKGPYLVMSAELRTQWWGTQERKKYNALKHNGDCSIHEVVGKPALVLGEAKAWAWAKNPDGGTLVGIVAFPGKELAEVAALYPDIPDSGWRVVAEEFPIKETLRCFDAARTGSSTGDRESLELKLRKGKYFIGTRRWKPKKGIELILVLVG
jgi:hypothetical protein